MNVALRIPPPEKLRTAVPQRDRLAGLIEQTIAGVQQIQIPDPAAREAVLRYRSAKTLQEMDLAYDQAVGALSSSLFGLLRYEKNQELQLLRVLRTLDPDRADQIAGAIYLSPPAADASGLEEASVEKRRPVLILGPDALAVLEAIPIARAQGGRPVTVASVVHGQQQKALFEERAGLMGLEIARVVDADQEPYLGDWEQAVSDLVVHFESKQRSTKAIMTPKDLRELGRFLGVPDLDKFAQAALEEVQVSIERYL